MRITSAISVLLVLAGASATRMSGAPPLVSGLRCELSADPLGIDVAKPRLSWVIESDERGQSQSGWQVLVATSEAALATGKGDLWDSGRVASGQTSGVLYGGTALASSQRVVWKARAWDGGGRETAWSANATWTMGLLSPSDWKASWITAPGSSESLLLRKEFTVRAGLRRALAHVCGLGQYELSLDGVKAGDDLLAPGWSVYDKTTLYDTRDVTALLHEGLNAAGLVLGNGMYSVERRGRFTKFTGVIGPLRAIVHLRLEYADGSTDAVVTDESWRVSPGPITAGNAYVGEDFDARLEPSGWDKPGFDDSRWLLAASYGPAGATLRGHSASDEPLRVIESRRPIAQWTLPDGSVVYDLGQNASTMPRIRVSGPAGSTVRLIPSEVVNPDGTQDRATTGAGIVRGSSWWQYTKATGAPEGWTPRFCYIGCRYLRAIVFPAGSALPPTIVDDSPSKASPADGAALPRLESMEGLVVHSCASPAGQFSTSNELLNRIHSLVRWAQRSNMVSVLTDCPTREKLGWLEQYHLNGPSIRYEFDVNRIYEKGMNDMENSQHVGGLLPNIAPEYAKFEGAFLSAAEWGAAFIAVPWQQYEFTGDLGLFRSHYGAMKSYYAYLESKASDGILSEGLGDWYDLGPKRPMEAQLTLANVTATAFMFEDARILSQAAGLLGKPADAADYGARASRIRAAFNRTFFHGETGTYAGGSQCANALALVLGIAEPADRPRVLAALVRDVEAHGDATTAGDVGYRYVLQALAQGGRSDLIYRMINQDSKPGYGYQLRMGATSLTESWDANRHASQDHFMLGQVIEWFYRDLAGIDFDPASPGFRKVSIHPDPVGDLAWVQAAYDSINGKVLVRWEHHGDRFILNVTVPANCTATVAMPSGGGEVTESGSAAASRPDVAFAGRVGHRAVYEVGSGAYLFESSLKAPGPQGAAGAAAAEINTNR
jgi:alpha-L-rhamnosidase